MNIRQVILEDFLNDNVKKLALGLYEWRGHYYEVLRWSTTKKRHNWSGFISQVHEGQKFMIREASRDVIRKYYPKISLDK